MKIRSLLLILSIGLIIFACKDDDDEINTDPVKQAVIDDEDLVEYLQTHYLNEEDGGIYTIDGSQTPLMEQVEVDNIEEDDISYKLYYLVEENGTTISPSRVDSVLTTYTGMRLDSTVFDSRSSLTWLPLSGVIKGWSYGFMHYKGGEVITNPDESFDYENYGQGILFIPSGLAYGVNGSQSIAPNTPLVFQITLQDVKRVDNDSDLVLSINEDVNGNGDLTDDDTDGDEIPNFADVDDDGDGTLTKYEDLDKDGDPRNDDTDGDGVPNYLDSDNDESNEDL